MQRTMKRVALYTLSIVFTLNLAMPAQAMDIPEDSLKSVAWGYMVKDFILPEDKNAKKIIMNDAVKVYAPKVAENQMTIPVHVDASAIKNVQKIVVIADLNPIPKVLTYEPLLSDARLSFRIKLQQGSPVRAAVLDDKGTWHIAGTYVDAAGGGCTAPALAYGEADWTATLARVRAKVWRQTGKSASKVRLTIKHPMDTGLADGIPKFYVEKLEVKDLDGSTYGRLSIFEPVSENPTLTLFPRLRDSVQQVKIEGRDSEGNQIRVKVPAPIQSSALNLE